MLRKRPRPFYGWLIVFVSAVGLFLGAPLLVFSFSVFFQPLVVDFHASRAAVSFAFSLFNMVGALWIPGIGIMIDRFGARRVVLVSTVLYALLLCSALWLGSSLWQLYLFFSLLGIAMASGPAPVPYGVVVSHWFDRHRGLALGLSITGIGLGSIVVPVIARHLIALFGWRMAFAIFGGAVLLLPLPIVAGLLQNDPAERGLLPDGEEKAQVTQSPAQAREGLSWHEIWHSPTFWIMIGIFSLAGAGVHGAIIHMSEILADRGVTEDRAAIAISLIGIGAIAGRVGSGYLLDHIFAPRVAILFYGATAVGMGILAAGSKGNPALVAALLVGLGMGAEVETMGYMISRYFGLHAFGAAYGHAFGAYMLAGSVGVLAMGAGYDRFHSYSVPLTCFCVALALTLVLLTRLGPYRYGAEPETRESMAPVNIPSGA